MKLIEFKTTEEAVAWLDQYVWDRRLQIAHIPMSPREIDLLNLHLEAITTITDECKKFL